jgi:magnesium transporter
VTQAKPGFLRATLFDADRRDREVELTPQLVRSLNKRKLLWVDIPTRDREALAEVGAVIGLSEATVDALAEEHGRARLVREPKFVHLTVEALELEKRRIVARELDLVAGPNLVVSTHDGPVEALDRFAEQFHGDTILGQLDAGSFLGSLGDSVATTWFARIEEIEREIDRLDEIAMRGPGDTDFLEEVLRLRRRIAIIRRTLAPHRDAFSPLTRPDFDLDERLGKPWPGLLERLERAIDAAENARELLVGSFDLYLGRAAQRTNEVMKALTIVSSVLLPSIVLAGIMGMNFKLAFFDQTSNFWLVIGAMFGLAAVILGVARLRRWI